MNKKILIHILLVLGLTLGINSSVYAGRWMTATIMAITDIDYFTILGNDDKNIIKNTSNDIVIGPLKDLHIVAISHSKSGAYASYDDDNNNTRFINVRKGVVLPEHIDLRVPDKEYWYIQDRNGATSWNGFRLLDENGQTIISDEITDYRVFQQENFIMAKHTNSLWYAHNFKTGELLLLEPIAYEPEIDDNHDLIRLITVSGGYHYFDFYGKEVFDNVDGFKETIGMISNLPPYKATYPELTDEDKERIKNAKHIPNTELVYVKEKDGYHIFNTERNTWFPDTYSWIDTTRNASKLKYGLVVKINGRYHIITSYSGEVEFKLPDNIDSVVDYSYSSAVVKKDKLYAAYNNKKGYMSDFQSYEILLNDKYGWDYYRIDMEH